MNAKKFLKRMNRGVLLGIIAITGLVIYLIIDTVSFKKDIPKFEQFIENYYAEISEIAVTPEENRKVDNIDIINKELARVKKDYTNFANENWTNYSNEFYYYMTKEDVMDTLEQYNGFESKYLEGYVTNWSYKLSNIEVNKLGPNIVSISYTDDVTVEVAGNPLIMNVDGLSGLPLMDYVKNYEGLKGNNELRKVASSSQRTIKLMKIDGEWKIYGSENVYGSNSFEVVGGDGNVDDIKG